MEIVEREITRPVDLCRPDGRLNPGAVGWSRTPLHRTALREAPGPAGWGRNKRWEYWGVVTPTHVVGLTISNLDYAAVHQLWVLVRATGEVIDAGALAPLALGTRLPASLGLGPARGRALGPGGAERLALAIDEAPSSDPTPTTVSGLTVPAGAVDPGRETHLRARSPRVQLDLRTRRLPGGEAMCVVVPWDVRRFQYTVKDLAVPMVGTITVDGVTTQVGDGAWGVLDHGRGRWPYSMTWSWAAGSGEVGGTRLGLQLGGRWTEGTGSTENALVVDGVTHKISEELTWEYSREDWLRPWRVVGERVDATFTPFHARHAVTKLGVLAGDTTQCFGVWDGWAADDDGRDHPLTGLVGWAEEAHNRW